MDERQAISPELIAAYRATDYRAWCDGVELALNIDQPHGMLEVLLAQMGVESAAFITAYNPFSQSLSDNENAGRQRDLRADLDAMAGLVIWDAKGQGQGQDAAWPAEPSFLIWGIGRGAAEALARKYEQNAFLWVEQGGVPELVFWPYG